jgi:hypothetical protein
LIAAVVDNLSNEIIEVGVDSPTDTVETSSNSATSDVVDEDAELLALLAEEEARKEQEIVDEEDESSDSLTPEEELLLLEEDEESEDDDDSSLGSDISELPEDIWSIHRAGSGSSQGGGVIRFAEDIEDLRGGVTARKGRRTPPQQGNRNRKARPAKKRR